MRNVAGAAQRYSYVYWYGSDPGLAPPELEVIWTEGPQLYLWSMTAGQTGMIEVSDATPGGRVIIGYSLSGTGPVHVMTGSCGLVTANLTLPITQLPPQTVDPFGWVFLPVNVPPGTAGTQAWFQALDLAGCAVTNMVPVTIQ